MDISVGTADKGLATRSAHYAPDRNRTCYNKSRVEHILDNGMGGGAGRVNQATGRFQRCLYI
jgi:hypothetical protein